MNTETEIDLVIDTNLYAGNFERELCAYCTGVWDDETHGSDQAAVFQNEVDGDPFENLVEPRSDGEHGWMRPQHLERTPPDFEQCNSVAIHFEARPNEYMIQLVKDRAYKFAQEGKIFDRPVAGLEILGFRILTTTMTTTSISETV